MYHIDEANVHGPHDLSLSLEHDGVIEVAMVDAAVGHWWQELPKDVRDLTNRSDLSKQQQEKLCTLLSKWEKVFPKQDEDFRRTDLVQHRIHIRKTLLIGMVEKGII